MNNYSMESISNMKNILINKQEELKQQICLENNVDLSNLHTVAGVDLAYWKEDEKEYACCCIVVLELPGLSIVEKEYSFGEITVPYIPGCLAFREFDLVEKTVSKLKTDVDLFVFDGNGYLHPRHMGLATYAGIMLGKPSMGIAKSFYKFSDFDYTDLPSEALSFKDIVIDGEVYGRVIRTHEGVKPIFLSTGNMIDLETATKVTEYVIDKESHIPSPTRFADIMTHEVRNMLRKTE